MAPLDKGGTLVTINDIYSVSSTRDAREHNQLSWFLPMRFFCANNLI